MIFHPYGLMISLGLLAGMAVAWWRKKLYGISENDLETLFLLVAPLGVIGARIYHVLDKWSYYSQNPSQIIAVWNGGLGIYGGVLGGLAGLGIFILIKNKNVMPNFICEASKLCLFRHPQKILKQVQDDGETVLLYLDFLMPSLAIGQAVARWGDFFNREVFGPPTSLPWGWYIPFNYRPEMWKSFSFFQPTFAYESLWAFIGFFFLIFLERSLRGVTFMSTERDDVAISTKKKIATLTTFARNDMMKYGLLTGFYAVWYGVGRFFLEFLRFDTAEISGIKTAQIISLLLVVFGWRLLRHPFVRMFRNGFGTRPRKG